MSHLRRVQDRMRELGVPAMLVSDISNIQWLSGFTGSSAIVVLTTDQAVFITDSRYALQVGSEVRELEVVTFASPRRQIEVARETMQRLGVTEIGFEPSITHATWTDWQTQFEGVTLVPQKDLLPPLRMIKTPDEIAKLEAACGLADACFQHVLRMVQPGVAEYDLGLEIEFYIRRQGAKLAFDVIAVSGPNSAKPHGKPTERKLEIGDFVTFDFGAGLDGYNSDLTRTVVVGKASNRHRMIYERVLESQVAAIEALKPGAKGRDVDSLVRQILDKDNLSQYFGHGLGHGLGRAVHDYGGLNQTTEQPIEEGQVWTVEPGVYIDGFGGVRIEDDVVIESGGARVLTHAPKHLIEVGA